MTTTTHPTKRTTKAVRTPKPKRSTLTPTLKPGARPRHDVVRVALYLRVSHDKSGILRSTADQLTILTEVADRRGWKVVAVFDEGEHATGSDETSASRVKFFEMLQRISEGDFDRLMTLQSSRAGRNKTERDMLIAALQSSDTKWYYDDADHDLNNENDEYAAGMDQLDDVRYSKRLRKRVSQAIDLQAAAGAAHGRVPFGYDRVKVNGMATNVPNEYGPFVTDAAAAYLGGTSLRSITAWLNDVCPLPAKPPTKRRPNGTRGGWDRAAVRAMLINPTYVGWRVHTKKTIVLGEVSYETRFAEDEHGNPRECWKPLITAAQHHEIVEMFEHVAKNTPNRGNDRRHLLSGVALCGVDGCDAVLHARNVNHTFAAYVCSKSSHLVIHEGEVDRLVIKSIIGGIKREFARTTPSKSDAHERIDNEIARLQTKIAELQFDIDNDDECDANALSKGIAARVAKIEALEASRPTRNVRPSTVDELLTAVDPIAKFKGYTLEQQAALLRSLARITVKPATGVSGVFDPNRVEMLWLDDEGNVRDEIGAAA